MLDKKPDKRILVMKNQIYSIKDMFKAIKKTIEAQDFIYHEKEQTFKQDQYGRQITADFTGSDEMDEFASAEVLVKCKFSDVQEVKKGKKNLDHGDVEILILPKVTFDYKNNWASSKFGEFLFKFWFDWFKDDDFKKKYLKPTQKRINAIYEELKKTVEYYQ
jgi:hypothetical protein